MSTIDITRPQHFGPTLNAEQRLAATHGERESGGVSAGPLLVIAGAGTGKTNTLAHRVAYLLMQRVSPERVLLLTFTRRAAQEMTSRAERILADLLAAARATGTPVPHVHANATRALWSGTFHAIGNRLLREYAGVLGIDPAFTVLDRGDAADLIDVARTELGFAKQHKRFPRKDTCLAIYSHRVNTRGTLVDTLAALYPWCDEWRDELTQLFRRYVATKQSQHVLDYDDLLLYWHILVQQPEVAKRIAARFAHILVDEYQDTNTLQAEILYALKPDGQGLCAVGDDAQSIYAFRAATVENILGFPERFSPPARVVTLEANYRSVQPILDAANALMKDSTRGYRKALHSARASEQRPFYVSVEDERAQSRYVVETILAAREQGVALRKQAVLMRSAQHSDELEVELTTRNIPFVKYGGLKFLEAAHVKDVLGVLRFVDNPRHRLAGFRTLQLLPGIGPGWAERALAALEAAAFAPSALASLSVPAAAREPYRAFCELLLALHGDPNWPGQFERVRRWYEPHLARLYDAAVVRAADLEQLQRMAEHAPSRERFVTDLTLDPPQATSDRAGPPLRDEDYLVLSTVHSAKGQEWNNVYVLNVTDGNFPNEFATNDAAAIEEERRLMYVAMTRAKDELHLVAPLRFYVTQQRKFGERHVYGARSRFLTEPVLATFEPRAWALPSAADAGEGARGMTLPTIDAAAALRRLWD